MALPSDCVNIIECIYTNKMAITSPGNIILWGHPCYVFCHLPKCHYGVRDSIIISTYDLENQSTGHNGKAHNECSRKLLVWMRTCKNVQCQSQELGLTFMPRREPWMVIRLDGEKKIICLDVEIIAMPPEGILVKRKESPGHNGRLANVRSTGRTWS